MKLITKVILLLLTVIGISQAQSIRMKKANDGGESKIYKIDPQPYLQKSNEFVAKFLAENPDYFKQQKLQKTTSWDFTVGSTRSWISYDFKNDSYPFVPSTCRAIGTNCYIFVEDAIWNSKVTMDNVNAIINAFDNSTPADANKGIYDTNVETFGNPPDVDNDEKIIILIQDIKDNYDGDQNRTYIGGYFHSINEIKVENSNRAEIYYLDAYPTDLSSASGLEGAMSTTAHEFQHMINFNYHDGTAGNPVETTFLNEGCSLAAEVVCGYPIYSQSLYNNEFNHYLLDWRTGQNDVINDYSRAARYMTYMYEQFGVDFLKKLVQSDWAGIVGIDDALSKLTTPTDLRFGETLENWFTANAINMKDMNSSWGYSIEGVNTVNPLTFAYPIYTSEKISVEKAASDYVSFAGGKNLSIQFDNYGLTKLIFKAFKYYSDNTVEVQDIDANTPYNFADFGNDIKKITFGIFNTSPSRAFDYSYIASGEATAVTLAYDLYEPTGVLSLTNMDTVCVVFDGISGGKIDSIRVALRQAGTVYGGLYEYAQTLRPSPLGNKLTDLTVTSNITEKPVYDTENETYPVPFPNWITVDLSSQNIDASKPFVAAFLVHGTYPDSNRIMVTEQTDDGNYHSFSYLHNPSSGDPDWYYLTSSDTTIYAYLIRAYVGFGVTDVDEQVAKTVPSKFNLDQNYPNPFNPTTTIRYSIPNIADANFSSTSNVQLIVYDVLGSKIRTLVNETKQPGNYEVNFDARNLSSGIYYYQLKSGNYVATKKMILMK